MITRFDSDANHDGIARRRSGPGRPEARGIALIMVIVVLMALLLIATPFAVSMRDHTVSVVMADSVNRTQDDVNSVRDFVVGRLGETTHFGSDQTPEVDSIEEIEAAADLSAVADLDGVHNPRGPIWSASLEDEQAKLNVNAASPYALANLFGARTVLSEKIADSDTQIPVEDSSIFDPEGGYVVVGAELIKYASVQLGYLVGCERGVNGVEEEPARLGVTESYYFAPGCLVRISDGVRTDYAMISEVSRGFRSLMSGRGGSVQITSGFTQAVNHGTGTPVVDARVFAVNMYRILKEPGKCYRYPTVSAIRQITDLGIPGFDPEQFEKLLPYLTVYSQHEGAARWGNHRTVLNDFTYREVDWLGYHTRIEYEVRYPFNMNTAKKPLLRAMLLGLSGERQQEEVTAEMADKLVERIVKARAEEPLKGYEDFLDRVLQPAVDAEDLPRGLRGSVFQNFFDSPMLVFLKGGTHRAIFKSLDTFTIYSNVSLNNAAGVELARRRVKDVVSVAPPRLLSFGLDSQLDFELQFLAGRYSRFVTTYPVNVETQQSPQDPPMFDPPNRSMKQLSGYLRNIRRERRGQEKRDVFASREKQGAEGQDEGSVRYRPHRSADGWSGMRGTEPNRMFVEHFDNNEDIEGVVLTSGTRRIRMMSGFRMGRRGRRGRGGQSSMSPMVIGLWYKPLWEEAGEGQRYIWGTGDNPRTDKVELFYDGTERALVLEIADTGLNRPLDMSRAYFPILLQRDTWYHIACVIAGTRPDQMQILVDGVPFRGSAQKKQHYRFLTRLVTDVSADETSIPVANTDDFPNYGVLLIGEEKIEYNSKSKKSFNVIRDNRKINLNLPLHRQPVKRGRGARAIGTTPVAHREGAAVTLFGYANALASDLRPSNTYLSGVINGSLQRWEPALLDGTEPVATVPSAPLGILAESTEINLRPYGSGTGGQAKITGFQQSGFALLIAQRATLRIEYRQGSQPSTFQTEVGGMELIHYRNLSGTLLQGVTRGILTPGIEDTAPRNAELLQKATNIYLNGAKVANENKDLKEGLFPTWVIPISLQVSKAEGLLDPAKTLHSERVQINTSGRGRPEWVRYDELLNYGGNAYLVRSNFPDLEMAFFKLARRAVEVPKDFKGNAAFALNQTINTEPLTELKIVTEMRNAIEFRGADDTLGRFANDTVAHPNNAEIIQVFRTELPAAGPSDQVTLVDQNNSTKERHFVRWAAANRESYIGRARGQSTTGRQVAHFVGFEKNVGRGFVSTTEQLRGQGQRGGRNRRGRNQRSGVDRTPSQINWDTRRVTRILKAPSGELPARATSNLIVGGTFGGRRASCVIDEVETFPHNEATMRRLVATEAMKIRYQNAINPATNQQGQKQQEQALAKAGRFIAADAVEVPLAYANVWTDFDGLTREREYFRGSFGRFTRQNRGSGGGGTVRSPFPYTRRSPDDRDAGLIRIGEEFIVYRGIEQKGQSMEVVLKDCIRGAFGTEALAHEQGESALFLGYVEMTVLRGGVTAEGASLPVENTRGFAPQGYVAVFDSVESGSVQEIIGYTETRGGSRRQGTGAEFIMPERVDKEQMKTLLQNYQSGQEKDDEQVGAGIFRGRFGTLAARHASGAVIMRLPFRYWDRAVRNADNPELGYFQFPLNKPGAFFKGVTWGERFPQRNLDVRVLARVDQRASWAEEPGGAKNGLYEFMNPRGKNDPNRIDMQGNLLEVRVFFEYRSGAFDPFFNADGWKETPWLTRVRVDYVQPNQVLCHEERR